MSTDTDNNSEGCSICMQPFLRETLLPCNHSFCFLCTKGMALNQGHCGLCRAEIPEEFLVDPSPFIKDLQAKNEEKSNE